MCYAGLNEGLRERKRAQWSRLHYYRHCRGYFLKSILEESKWPHCMHGDEFLPVVDVSTIANEAMASAAAMAVKAMTSSKIEDLNIRLNQEWACAKRELLSGPEGEVAVFEIWLQENYFQCCRMW